MLNVDLIRQNPETIKTSCVNKNVDPKIVDDWLKADLEKRQLIAKTEALRAQRNKFTKDDIDKGKAIKQELKELELKLKKSEETVNELINKIPNPPLPDVPVGKDEKENKVIKQVGDIPRFNFPVKDHVEIGKALDLIDLTRAAKVSGSRFAYLKNELVLLEFALVNYALEFLVKEGFTPVLPPALTKINVFHKLGYSEHHGNEEYYLVYDPNKEKPEEGTDYYLIGTAEHSLVPMFMDEVFLEKDLPKRLVGFSPSFRREAGSWGKDNKGIFRVHQFDKIEMVSFTKPEDSNKEHQYLLSLEEKLVKSLCIPYQVVQMCTGDLGFPVANKLDLECWIPSQNKYRETHSCSNTTDFQARRLNIKYTKGNKREFVHILNGTAFAIGRMLIAILENFQQQDGSVKIPQVLQKYIGKDVISFS